MKQVWQEDGCRVFTVTVTWNALAGTDIDQLGMSTVYQVDDESGTEDDETESDLEENHTYADIKHE